MSQIFKSMFSGPAEEKSKFGARSRKRLSNMMGRFHGNNKQKTDPNGCDIAVQSDMINAQHSIKTQNTHDQENNNLENDNSKKEKADLIESSMEDEDEDTEVNLLPEEQADIPTFLHTQNCDQELIEETRRLLRERYAKNPDNFYDHDYKRMLTDDWTVSRFLLRRRLEPKRAAKLMEECGRFRKLYKMSEVKLWEFPVEFHQAGGLFKYASDRVGNITVYMRTKMYRRVPEISDVFKAFILCVLEEADSQNCGRGVAIIFDLTGCGLQNVDLGFLSWLLSSFRNYCPKGVSYIMVYNLPWFLNATCKLAISWLSASNKRALRFVHGREIETFIAVQNLPDYLGGCCKLDYKAIPEGSLPAIEVCDKLDMSKEQALKIRELFTEYLPSKTGQDVALEAEEERGRPQSGSVSPSSKDTTISISSDDENEDDDDQFVDCDLVDHSATTQEGVTRQKHLGVA